MQSTSIHTLLYTYTHGDSDALSSSYASCFRHHDLGANSNLHRLTYCFPKHRDNKTRAQRPGVMGRYVAKEQLTTAPGKQVQYEEIEIMWQVRQINGESFHSKDSKIAGDAIGKLGRCRR